MTLGAINPLVPATAPAVARVPPKEDPILLTSWKAAMVFAVFCTIVMVWVTIAASQGHFPFNTGDWQFKVLAGVSGVWGCSLLLLTPLIICYYFGEKKAIEERELRRPLNRGAARAPHPPALIPINTPPVIGNTTNAPLVVPNPVPRVTNPVLNDDDDVLLFDDDSDDSTENISQMGVPLNRGGQRVVI